MRRLSWSKFIGSFVLSLFVVLFFGVFTNSANAKKKDVVIGNILPLSGPSASAGVEGKQMREFVVKQFNANGGFKCSGELNGAKIKMIYLDTKSDPTVGVTDVQQLINKDHVNLITGAWNSGVTYPSSQVAEMHKVPFIVPVSVMDRITDRGFKYLFRLAAKDSWWARDQFRFIDYLSKKSGKKITTLGLVYVNNDFGKSFDDLWKKLAKEHGYKVVLNESYAETATDLTPVVLKIKSSKPQVVLVVSDAADAILLQNTMANYNVRPLAVISSGGGQADPAFIKNTGKNAEYLFDISEWAPDMNKPGLKELNEKFKKEYGIDINGETMDAYIGMHTIIAALEKTCSTDPDKFRKTMQNIKLCSGPFSVMSYPCVKFDKTGQNIDAGLIIVQVRKVGDHYERVTIWPEEDARAGFKVVFPQPNHY
jgi:branched-chain amino acid transport system substrate-binding protein